MNTTLRANKSHAYKDVLKTYVPLRVVLKYDRMFILGNRIMKSLCIRDGIVFKSSEKGTSAG